MATDQKVRISKENHPHFGDTGVMTGKKKSFKRLGELDEVLLDSCKHDGMVPDKDTGELLIYVFPNAVSDI